ncbi:hypothetical protein P280DRAFT_544725 [Massarina eburnea CBS 473.64]|uniref:tRNA/rRNA methyltransferase SpoU type domain-containing protein n=1 Tax=Massarina eburnea CBS 473.64 TaxID=1395130 RepID=A0A6A6SHC5_9PLEO|nr:hypothetical protein P280DRAFT_544725 [Massarina eburnea CBS 473.64]
MAASSNADGGRAADVEAILQFSDESTRKAAFDHYWKKLKAASALVDLSALRICVRLLPPQQDDASHELLAHYIVDRIPTKLDSAESLYILAEICLSDAQLGSRVFENLTAYIVAYIVQGTTVTERSQFHPESPDSDHLRNVVAYLKFIRSSFWLPPTHQHYLTTDLLHAVVKSIGVDGLDEYAHDALSALLNLVAKPSVVVVGQDTVKAEPADAGLYTRDPFLHQKLVDNSLFSRFEELRPEYFVANAGPAFRTWYQWITHATTHDIQLDAVHSSFYWETLRKGLLTGFSDQRKYCLGTLRQSLILSSESIDTSVMLMDVNNRKAYIAQYDRFSTLFETIVLDRYANQVQACLPELSALLGPESLISPSWATALLSSALDSKVQDGIRKLIGNWVLEHISSGQGSVGAHLDFFVNGLLPWATQGNLFTSSMSSTRNVTVCTHGAALANAISQLIVSTPADSDTKKTLSDILTYILDTGGRIFSPSVLFILEGLLSGLKIRLVNLEATEVQLVFRISRLPAFPEIAADLLSVYCAKLSNYIDSRSVRLQEVPGFEGLDARYNVLEHNKPTGMMVPLAQHQFTGNSNPLGDFVNRLRISQHKTIQSEAFGAACGELLTIFQYSKPEAILPNELLQVLDALWEEADRLEYPRSVIVNIPPIFFHAACLKACVLARPGESASNDLVALLQKVLDHMQRLTEGKPYLLSVLGISLRKACFFEPQIMHILPLEDFLVRFINNPPLARKEFLFEVVAAQKLEAFFPHRSYASYYGEREWYGYAAILDLLNRFPESHSAIAKCVLDRILDPWRTQTPPVPIIGKWKNVFQLQTMLLLAEKCIGESDVDAYLDGFMHALFLEQWPRYRFLLEWIITRIYHRFPGKVERVLTDLANLNENSPVQIASLTKLALLSAPFLDSESFTLKLMIQLIPFSASPKVHVRHEAHWSFPIIFGLAKERGWRGITENPAFQALDHHVRSLDKFITPPLTIRTIKLDAVKDFTLTNIFQGQYLNIETPELERVAHKDFQSLYEDDCVHSSEVAIPPAHVPLGGPTSHTNASSAPGYQKDETVTESKIADANPAFFQTKSGFDFASLLPAQGPPSSQQKRPASVVLIASLIDNPTNLGGLSRISESFGLEALYIDDLKKTAHRDFKATSVTSEKHLTIRQLKVPAIPDFLISMKRQGYEVVGIEQTDRSGMLGEEAGGKGVGTLPEKCVLVLGSERGGITSEVLAAIDRCVEIKTVGVTRSLNVQTAGGIAVYEWWREWARRRD